jgi:hypothetical protein
VHRQYTLQQSIDLKNFSNVPGSPLVTATGFPQTFPVFRSALESQFFRVAVAPQ